MYIVKPTITAAQELLARIDAAMGFPKGGTETWVNIIAHKTGTEFYVYYSADPLDNCKGATQAEIIGAITSIPESNIL